MLKASNQGILTLIDARQCSIASISGALHVSPWRELAGVRPWCQLGILPAR